MASVLAWIGRAALFTLIAASVWFYGGVEQWFQSVAAVVLATVGLGTAAALAVSKRAEGRGIPVAVAGPLGLAAVALLQLWGGRVSADATGGGLIPRTVYPADTRLALASYLAAAMAAYAGVVLFKRQSGFVVLLAALVAMGAATGVLGMGLRLTGEDRVIRGAPVTGDPFAHFVNRNNAAGFLQIGLAAGLGWLRAVAADGDGGTAGTFSRRKGVRDRVTPMLAAVVGLAFCLAGIVASRSRGGILSAAVTVVVGILVFGRGKWISRISALVPGLAIAVGLLLWLGLASPAVERFKAFRNLGLLSDGRFLHWQDAAHAVLERPIWGGGAGAYLAAYPEFSRHTSAVVFRHADGQFVELGVELGAAGGLVLAGVASAVTVVLVRRGPDRAVERVALVSLLAGQATHALFDFAIVVPAVATAAALLGGASIGRMCLPDDRIDFEPSIRRSRRLAAAGIGIALSAGLIWAAGEHRCAWAVDRAVGSAHTLMGREELSPDVVDAAIAQLMSALRSRPDDAEGHRAAGELWVGRYRFMAGVRLREIDPSLSPAELRRLTSLVSLQGTANLLSRSGAVAGLEEVRNDPLVTENLVPAERHYEQAAAACPRLFGVWLPLSMLQFTDPAAAPSGIGQVAIAAKLFPADAGTQRLAGRLAWQSGDVELAGRCWRRTFRLKPEGYGVLLSELAGSVGPEQAVELTCPSDAEGALSAAAFANGLSDELERALGARLAVLAEESRAERVRLRCLAVSAWLLGRTIEAESALNDNVALFPDDARVRADLARFLLDDGRPAEAAEVAEVAQALDPADPDVRHTLALIERGTAGEP